MTRSALYSIPFLIGTLQFTICFFKKSQHKINTQSYLRPKPNPVSSLKTEDIQGLAVRDAHKMARDGDDAKGLLWKLPVLKTQQLGKLGPAFGFGVGCGVGFGIGLLGGVGIGPGIPGMQVGLGVGAGCGVGLGFGYGAGKGVARDDIRKYSNVGNLFYGETRSANPTSQDDISALFDELVDNTKKLVRATTREMEKWTK